MENNTQPNRMLAFFSATVPIILLCGLVYWFINGGSKNLEQDIPPVEEVSIRRVVFTPGLIDVSIRNTGPMAVDMTLVTVDEALWKAEFRPDRHLEPMEEATVLIPYDWVETDPLMIEFFTSSGGSFGHETAVVMETPKPGRKMVIAFAAMGAYVGILPVLLGILFLPFLRQISAKWTQFILSLTIGLLVFLAVDSFHESLEIAEGVPERYQGVALVAFGILLAILVISSAERIIRGRQSTDTTESSPLMVAYLVAFGIGIHNLGEGLAIGSAYAVGEVALGATLLIGFTIHNTTEGVAIVAPLTRSRVRLGHLALLGLVGGCPTIIGCWIGGFIYSDVWAVLFLGIGTGAIIQVVWTIGRSMQSRSEESVLRPANAFAFLLGMVVMYATAMMVAM